MMKIALDKKAQDQAEELANLTRLTVEKAVSNAISESLERNRRKGVASRLLEIGKECAQEVRDPLQAQDHATLLYDESGLP